MRTKEELLKALSDCVVDMEDEEVNDVAKEYVEAGYPAIDGILEGLVDGMNKAAQLYEEEEYYIPELLIWLELCWKPQATKCMTWAVTLNWKALWKKPKKWAQTLLPCPH